jgi:hypothetical protein
MTDLNSSIAGSYFLALTNALANTDRLRQLLMSLTTPSGSGK